MEVIDAAEFSVPLFRPETACTPFVRRALYGDGVVQLSLLPEDAQRAIREEM